MSLRSPMPQPGLQQERWHPVPLVWISLAWHVLALLALAWKPAAWPWWLAVVALNHLLISVLVFLPRNHWLGRTHTRLPAQAAARGYVSLTFDDGPDPEVTPQVLDMLERRGARASFFCIGHKVQRHPALVQEIVARGHSVENHGHLHSVLFALWGTTRMRNDMSRMQQALQQAGVAPAQFFRPTAGFRNPFLDIVLAQMNLRLAMWTRRGFDTRDGDASRVLARLTRGLAAGDILLLHDGHGARTVHGQSVVLEVLPQLLDRLQAQDLRSVHLQEAFALQESDSLNNYVNPARAQLAPSDP